MVLEPGKQCGGVTVVDSSGGKRDAVAWICDVTANLKHQRGTHQQGIPVPSKGRNLVSLPVQTEIKAKLYEAMRAKGVRKAALARKLGWHPPQVDRLFDLRHNSKIGQLEAAFEALGAQLDVEVRK